MLVSGSYHHSFFQIVSSLELHLEILQGKLEEAQQGKPRVICRALHQIYHEIVRIPQDLKRCHCMEGGIETKYIFLKSSVRLTTTHSNGNTIDDGTVIED